MSRKKAAQERNAMDVTTFVSSISKTRPNTAAAIENLLGRVPALKTLNINITPSSDPNEWNFQTSFGVYGPQKYTMWLQKDLETHPFRDGFIPWYVASAFAHVYVQATGRKGTDKQVAKVVADWGFVEPKPTIGGGRVK